MSKITPRSSTENPWKLTTERVAVAGIFATITIILGLVPGLGFIPLSPDPNVGATTEHIPTILGGVVGGPIVGTFTGLIFGLLSFLRSTSPFFKDPTVSILPRLFIGIVSWAVFAGLRRFNRDAAAATAGLLGSATNSVLVLSMLVIKGYRPLVLILPIIPQAILEAIVASILTVILARVFYIIQGRFVRAPETKSREDLPY